MSYLPFFGASAVMLIACAQSAPVDATAEVRRYECAMGVVFHATISRREAIVETGSSSYALERRPSSLGERFATGDVALAQDEDSAVLIGADEGPYRDCHEKSRGDS